MHKNMNQTSFTLPIDNGREVVYTEYSRGGTNHPAEREKRMEKYKVYYYNGTTKKTKAVTVKALGIIQAIEVAIRGNIYLLGWEITKAEKI